ncbi:MAG: hypothetical protein Tsb002_33790 [Wenzhouxiangellaceae bacterium]
MDKRQSPSIVTVRFEFLAVCALCALFIGLFGSRDSSAQTLPVKIFIIAGQSNAVGDGRIIQGSAPRPQGTLEYVAANDIRGDYRFLVDEQGNWIERDDVWITNLGNGRTQSGNLRVNYLTNVDSDRVGPELGFGHVIGDQYDNPVLLIKLGYGGATLYNDFRPPSSGAPAIPNGAGDRECGPGFRAGQGITGDCYREVIDEVTQVTNNLSAYVDGYQAGQGYEIAGFIWIHGLTDRGNSNAWEEYESNMVNFITDIRSDLSTPNLPFVLVTPGMPCCSPGALDYTQVELAQVNVSHTLRNVELVDMRGGYLGIEFNHPAEDSPTDWGSWHYFQNAKTYVDMGLAAAYALLGDTRMPFYPNSLIPINQALNQPATQSSLGWGGVPSRAVDGNRSGLWGDGSVTHTNIDTNAWWQVDLAGASSVRQVRIYNRTDCCSGRLSNFNVDLLDAGGNLLDSATQVATADRSETFHFNTDNVHSVRVQLNGRNVLSQAEVEVLAPLPLSVAAFDNATVPSIGNVYSFDFSLGWEFSTAHEITITHLGMRDDNQDGILNGTRDLPIAIFNTLANGGAVLAQTTIPNNRLASADGVIYSDALATPLTLPAGTYVIGALTETGGEPYRQLPGGTAVQFANGVTFIRELANPGAVFQHPDNWSASSPIGWFGPTFLFNSTP